jgi:hypothetical protein
MGRYEGRVSIDKKTNKGTHQWWDRWDEKNKKLLTDKSKYKFSSATDETGKEIISEVISKETPLTKKVDLSKYDDDALNALVDEHTALLAESDKLSEAGINYGRVKEIEARRKEIREILKAAQDIPPSGHDNFKADLALDKQIKKGIDDVMKDTSEAGLKKSIEIDNLRLEFPGITDEMINNILIDTNPQRIAEVKQTMREALEMIKRGMGPEEVLQVLKDALKRPKQASGGRIGMRSGTKIIDYAIKVAELIAKHGPKMAERWKKFYEGFAIKASNEIRQGLGKWKDLTTSQKTTQHDNLTKVTEGIIKTKKYDPKLDEYAGINIPKEFIAAQAKVKKPKVKNEYYSKKEMEKEWELENKLAKQEMEQAHTFKLNKEKFMKEFPEVDAADVDILMSAEPDVQKIMIKGLYERRKDATAFDAILDSKPMKTIEDAQDAELRWQNYLMNKDKTPPTKHATGGRIGFAEGVGEMLLPKAIPKEIHHDKMLQRKEQEIAQLKEEIEKRKRGKQTILDNPGAFVDKEGRFTGEALIQSADNDIAALEKELNKYLNEERVPGHATGGVSNLFRRR